MIISAYTGWPGCAHGARVLRNSTLFTKGENGMSKIVKKRFNYVLSSRRQTIERAIGHLK